MDDLHARLEQTRVAHLQSLKEEETKVKTRVEKMITRITQRDGATSAVASAIWFQNTYDTGLRDLIENQERTLLRVDSEGLAKNMPLPEKNWPRRSENFKAILNLVKELCVCYITHVEKALQIEKDHELGG